MSNLTFLTQEQCFGDEKIGMLEKRGTFSDKLDIMYYNMCRGGNNG